MGLKSVATREGGVDRNTSLSSRHHSNKVATREGGVDRNRTCEGGKPPFNPSPPARVAWIETLCCQSLIRKRKVATREGGVDRNVLLVRLGNT